MTERHADLDAALDRVIEAARTHLAAVRAAAGRADDAAVWRAYLELNNASFAYDDLLLDQFGEVTPWDVEAIDRDETEGHFGVGPDPASARDPHPNVVSVRQRRDYRVPSVSALVRLADAARRSAAETGETPPAGVRTVGEAVLELMQVGDGSLGALDVPELDPLDGVVVVAEVSQPIAPESFVDTDAVGPFELGADDHLIDRIDEHTYIEPDPEAGDEATGAGNGDGR